MKPDRVFITGCGGMLGSAVYPYFVSRYEHVLATSRRVNEEWLLQLDVRDDARVSQTFKEYRPELVFHLAAETDLEYCETHSDIARDTNALATQFLARLCEEYGSTLVYISTAGVFDGLKNGFYTETDQPNPIMVYGQTKYEGELNAIENCSKTFVVRAGWMMGGGRSKEKKFIYKILCQIAEGNKEIFAVNDRWGTPTYAYDFVMNLFHLMDTEKYGTYHMVCEDMGNRYDVAKEILKICKRTDIKLTPVNSDFFKKEYFVARPKSEMLVNSNLSKIGLNHMRPWREALSDYIENYFFDYIDHPGSERIERRRHCRKNCYIPVKYSIQGELENIVYSGIRVDMGVSGVGLITDFALQPGQIIRFKSKGGIPPLTDTNAAQCTTKTGGKYRIGLKSLHNNHFVVTNIFQLSVEHSLSVEDCKNRIDEVVS